MKKERYIRFDRAMKRMLRDKAHFARRSLVGRQRVEPKEGMLKGMEKDLADGIGKGREEGMVKAKIQMVENLKPA